MDADRVGFVAASLTPGSRRRALTAALGAALSLLGLARPAEIEAGKCREGCGVCQRCQKGTCRRTKRGKVCTRGTCKAKATGAPCVNNGTCRVGVCCIAPGGTCTAGAGRVCCDPESDRAVVNCGAAGTCPTA